MSTGARRFWPTPFKHSVITKAMSWKNLHLEHVQKLTKETEDSYPPSAEHENHPELWKPAHWNWFNRNFS